jgi:hypothetical protein
MSTLDVVETALPPATARDRLRDEQLAQLTATVTWMAEEMRAQQALREQVSELAGDLATVAGPALDAMTARLLAAEERGWFTFARRVGRVADRVVTAAGPPAAPARPPGALALLRQLHDPDVRRGLARLLVALRAIGHEQVDQDRPTST